MAIEIVDFPIKNGGSFHSYVSSPEGILDTSTFTGAHFFVHFLALTYVDIPNLATTLDPPCNGSPALGISSALGGHLLQPARLVLFEDLRSLEEFMIFATCNPHLNSIK